MEQHCGHEPRRCSGRPNPPLACAQSISRLRLATANGRGFFGAATKDEKAKHLVKVANRSDIAGFQECHGTPAQVHSATKVLQSTHHIFWSSPVFEDPVNLSSDKFCVPKPLQCPPNGELCSDAICMSSDGVSDSSCGKSCTTASCSPSSMPSDGESESSCSSASSSCSDNTVFLQTVPRLPGSALGGSCAQLGALAFLPMQVLKQRYGSLAEY